MFAPCGRFQGDVRKAPTMCLAQELLQFLAQFRAKSVTRKRVGNVRGQESDLGTAIVDVAVKADRVERQLHVVHQLDH